MKEGFMMKMELNKFFKLMKYALNYKSVLGMIIFFAIFGLAWDLATVFLPDIFLSMFDVGAYFIILAGATLAHSTFSVIYVGLGATSGEYRNIMLKYSVFLITCFSLLGTIIPIIIHTIAYYHTPDFAPTIALSIIQTGVFALFIQIYFAFSYKLYALSSVIFVICFAPVANNYVWMHIFGNLLRLPIGVAIVICLAFTLSGSAAYYALSRLLYKKQLDALAFRSAIAKASK